MIQVLNFTPADETSTNHSV